MRDIRWEDGDGRDLMVPNGMVEVEEAVTPRPYLPSGSPEGGRNASLLPQMDKNAAQNEKRARNGQAVISHEHTDMPMFVQW